MTAATMSSKKMIPPEDLTKISEILQKETENILSKKSEAVTRYFAGNHRTVFELKEFPQYIIKFGAEDYNMLKTIQNAAAVVERLGLHRCAVPTVHLLPGGIWVEEKLDSVFDDMTAQNASEREFELFDADPALKQKWNEIFTQAALFIIEVGYWDTGWHNILLMKEGVGFVDFENAKPNHKKCIAFGLSSLLRIAPPACFDSLVKTIEERGYTEELIQDLGMPIENYQKERQQELEIHARVRKFHETKSFSSPTEQVDISSYSAGSWEYEIIKYFNMILGDKKDHPHPDLLFTRKLSLQPYFIISNRIPFTGLTYEERESLVAKAVIPAQAECEAALNRLKEANVIGEWFFDHRSSKFPKAFYHIYF